MWIQCNAKQHRAKSLMLHRNQKGDLTALLHFLAA